MNTPQNTYWNTRDGRKILIADMDLDHVQHCVSLMTRQMGFTVAYYSYCPRIKLCELITAYELDRTLAALTDPNQ